MIFLAAFIFCFAYAPVYSAHKRARGDVQKSTKRVKVQIPEAADAVLWKIDHDAVYAVVDGQHLFLKGEKSPEVMLKQLDLFVKTYKGNIPSKFLLKLQRMYCALDHNTLCKPVAFKLFKIAYTQACADPEFDWQLFWTGMIKDWEDQRCLPAIGWLKQLNAQVPDSYYDYSISLIISNYANYNGLETLITNLIALGFDINATNDDGETVLDSADSELEILLRKHGAQRAHELDELRDKTSGSCSVM